MKRNVSRDYIDSNCCTRNYYCWTCRYFKSVLKRKDIDFQEMLEEPLNHRTKLLTNNLEEKWANERTKQNPSLLRALWRVFKKQFLQVFGLGIFAESQIAFSFYLMSLILDNLVQGDDGNFQGLFLSLIFAFNLIFMVFHRHMYQQWNAIAFVGIRQVLSSLVFRKSLRLSLHSLSQASEGKIINAASGDLAMLDFAHFFIIHLVIQPFVSITSLLVLVSLIGLNALWSFLIIGLMVALQVVIGKILARERYVAGQKTDARVKLLFDVISGVRTVKAYGWELELGSRISDLRREQVSKNVKISCLKGINFMTLYYSGFFASAVIFFISSSQNTKLQPGPTFAALACYFYISLFTAFSVGTAIQSISQFKSIMRRITQILLLEQKDPKVTKEPEHKTTPSHLKGLSIKISRADVSWGESL